MLSYIKCERDIYQWQWVPNLPSMVNHTNLYYSGKYLTILYPKILDPPKNHYDLIQLTRKELINYIHLVGIKLFKLSVNRDSNNYCDVCNKYKSGLYYALITSYDNIQLYICGLCKGKHTNHKQSNEPSHIYYHVNKQDDNRPAFRKSVYDYRINEKIDITFLYHGKIYFLYHVVYDAYRFDYKTIITEPWYERDNDVVCNYCKQYDRIYHSMCQQCFDYTYKSFKPIVIGLLCLRSLLHKDITSIIFSLCLRLFNFQVDHLTILNYNKPKLINVIENDNQIKPSTVDLEEELITEDNMYQYVKFDLNDDDTDDDTELGYWEDD